MSPDRPHDGGPAAPPDAGEPLAPVELPLADADSVSHSLAILSTVYHYNHWIFDTIRDDLGRRIIEVGSGVGNITQFLLNAERVVCLEPFEPYRDHLRRTFRQHRNVSVQPCPIEDCPNAYVPAGGFDSVICPNVLEHIERDVDALRHMAALLVPGGRVIVLVPALPALYGEMDRAMGHVRRYTLGELKRKFREAGLHVERGRYMNLIGALGWWWQGRVRRRRRIPAGATRTFDRIVPVVSALERLVPVPLGQSAVIVGRT